MNTPEKSKSNVPLIILLFLIGLCGIILMFYSFPALPSDVKDKIKLPRSIQDAQQLAKVLDQYKNHHYFTVLAGYSLTYVFLQSFSIPGSIFLSFIAGTLFGLPVGLPLVCLLCATGASVSYCISFYLGKGLLERFAPDKAKLFGSQIEKHRHNLMSYMLFLRFSPFFPNWFVNIASPVFNVPLHIFFVATFIGVSGQSFFAVNAGTAIHEIKEVSDVINIKTFLFLTGLAIISILPTLAPVQSLLKKVLGA